MLTPWTPFAARAPRLSIRPPSGLRRSAVTGLLRLSALLLHVAVRLQHRAVAAVPEEAIASKPDPGVEFHAEAGAPEGALYVDGQFVGWLPGVARL